jgi:hypothetical protein
MIGRLLRRLLARVSAPTPPAPLGADPRVQAALCRVMLAQLTGNPVTFGDKVLLEEGVKANAESR